MTFIRIIHDVFFFFQDVNIKLYAKRRVKEAFDGNKNLRESKNIENEYSKGVEALQVRPFSHFRLYLRVIREIISFVDP